MGFARYRRMWIGAAALLLGAPAAWAQAQPEPQAQQRWSPERMQARVDRVRAELNLNAQQEALWQQAREQTRAAMRKGFEDRRALRAWVRAELDKPLADPRRIAEQREAFRAQRDADRRQVRDIWLALYDSFDAAQKEKAQAFMKRRLELTERHGHARGRRGEPR